jgi:hypothetical protein
MFITCELYVSYTRYMINIPDSYKLLRLVIKTSNNKLYETLIHLTIKWINLLPINTQY